MRFPAAIAVTVLRSPGRDSHGDRLPAVEHPLVGVAVLPGRSQESDDRGEQVITGVRLLAPPGADVMATDRVLTPSGEFAGTYDVLGRPEPHVSPFSRWAAGTVILLGEATG